MSEQGMTLRQMADLIEQDDGTLDRAEVEYLEKSCAAWLARWACWRIFHKAWKANALAGAPFHAPYQSCQTQHLFRVYVEWCRVHGRRPLGRPQFVIWLSGLEPRGQYTLRYEGRSFKAAIFRIGCAPSSETQQDWLGREVTIFEQRLLQGA